MTAWGNDSIRDLERASIRGFLERNKHEFYGNVLDFGAGRQQYRDIVEQQRATYVPFDRIDHPASIAEEDTGSAMWMAQDWDGILCTQVVQYVPDVPTLFSQFRFALAAGGRLVLTYPTCWDEVEAADLHRFTFSGIERLLKEAEFEIISHERRAEIDLRGFKFPLGGGVVAR